MRREEFIEYIKAFSGKYRICKLLGIGLNGKVYLVEHRLLNVYRAMKIVPKKNKNSYDQYKKEAMILRELKYPGIPIIYDMEEAQDYLYIIEEYIRGETLYERIHNAGTLSREESINLGIKLCNPIIYLHNRKDPILHLDIHPGNLIIQNDDIHLIDFDHSSYKIQNINLADGYGNKYFAAPEQKICAGVDIKTDIYAIAAIIYYAASGEFPKKNIDLPMSFGKKFSDIIRSCLNHDKDLRPESVEKLKESLMKLSTKSKKKTSQNIAIVGAGKGAGATYISLGLSAYLGDNKISTIYEEYNNSGHMALLRDTYIKEYEEYEAFRINNIYISPDCLLEKDKKRHSASVYIKDYGTDIEAALKSRADLIILVCRSNSWYIKENESAIDKISKYKNFKIIYNLNSNQGIIYKSNIGNRYNFPYIANILENKKDRNEIFKKITRDIFATNFKLKDIFKSLKSKLKNILK